MQFSSLFSVILSLFSSDYVLSNNVPLTSHFLFSAWSSLILMLFSLFFISFIVFSSFRICLFLVISISLLNYHFICVFFFWFHSLTFPVSLHFLNSTFFDLSQILTSLGLVTGNFLCSLGRVMFLKGLYSCLHIWRRSHLLQSLLTALVREILSVSPSKISEAFTNFYYGYTCSTFLVHCLGKIINIECLLSILKIQAKWRQSCIYFLYGSG